MQYTSPDNGQTSDMMWDAGRGGGGPWVHCSCGLDHSMSDVEFEQDDYNGYRYIELGGLFFVHGCDGCEKTLARYENWIWNNRDHIRRYLKIRIDQEKAWADQEQLMNTLAGI
jgi:hypothetical protein